PTRTGIITSRCVAVMAASSRRMLRRLPASPRRTVVRSTSVGGQFDEAGVAADRLDRALLVSPEDVRSRDAAAFFQLAIDVGRVVDAQNDEIAGARPVQRAASGLHLVQDDLRAAGPSVPRGDRALDPLQDEPRRVSRWATPGVPVLADDHVV